MKNTKKIILILTIGAIVVIIGVYIFYSHKKNISLITTEATTTSSKNQTAVSAPLIVYTNTDYGFTFSLPSDWKGYSIVPSTWTGYPLNATSTQQTGVTLLLRNPNWTMEEHYEDIPIMIFTVAQWNSYLAGDFSVSAAPFPASELGRNNRYVFALPPRWDYDFSQGYQEAENILSTNPLHPLSS